MASNILSRIIGPVNVANASTTVFTGTAAHTYTFKSIIIVNSTAAAISILLGIGGVAAANQILPSTSIAPGATLVIDSMFMMSGTETLQATTTATGLTLTASGLDQS